MNNAPSRPPRSPLPLAPHGMARSPLPLPSRHAPRSPRPQPRPPRLGLAAVAAIVVGAGAGACAHDESDAAPVRIAYTVAFPSIAAAVAADEVQIGAYPDEGPSTCLSLVQKRSSQLDLPAPVAPPVAGTPCALAGDDAASIEAGFGRIALLVVARRQGADFLIGCTMQSVTEHVESARVPLTLFSNTVVVPETTCATLSSHCGGGC
jgi:hypothetical protein